MNQHHVGGHRADHGPKHAPGVISVEGGSHGSTLQTTRRRNRTPAASLACLKPLDWCGPVTEVLTLGKEGGPQVHETLRKYDAEKMSYSYMITEVDPAVFPVTNYSSTLSVAPNADGGSKITWKAGFYRGFPNNDPPENMNDEAAMKAVTGLYELGLGALAERFGK